MSIYSYVYVCVILSMSMNVGIPHGALPRGACSYTDIDIMIKWIYQGLQGVSSRGALGLSRHGAIRRRAWRPGGNTRSSGQSRSEAALSVWFFIYIYIAFGRTLRCSCWSLWRLTPDIERVNKQSSKRAGDQWASVQKCRAMRLLPQSLDIIKKPGGEGGRQTCV